MNKILIVGPTPPPYHGVSVVTEIILNSALQKKFKLIRLDTTDPRSLTNIGRLDIQNIFLTVKQIFNLIRILFIEKADVVYIPICQTILGYLRDAVFIVLSKFLHSRVIVHLHGSHFRNLYERSNVIFKQVVKLTLKLVCKVIILSNNMRYIFRDLIPENKLAIVPNGLDERYFDMWLSSHGLPKKDFVQVLFLGTLARPKGFIDVLRSIPSVIDNYCNVKFIFAGELYTKWGEKKEAREFINTNKIESYVVFSGIVHGEEKYELLFSSDFFVFPSHNEGQPLVILEALAAGLPIISTDTGAIKEMVIDGENGFIVEKQNVKQIAEKIIRLLKDNSLRKKMGRKSRERFLKYYTKDKFIKRLTNVLEEVING